MREILFRGKAERDNLYFKDVEWKKGEWQYGDYQHFCDSEGIMHTEISVWGVKGGAVIPETVGQYTGLTDKNGNKIFEGDIVKNDWCFLRGYSVVKFGQYKTLDVGCEYQQGHLGFYLEHIHKVDKKTTIKDIMYFANKCEVIGNIHDNPELLGGE